MAFGSALTYTIRYFLLKYYQVATVDDDPDVWRSKQRAAENSAEQEALAEIRKAILDECNKKVESGVDKELLYKIISDNTNGKRNPNAIKDITVATNVLEQIKQMEAKK
jgi:hypothetical protein